MQNVRLCPQAQLFLEIHFFKKRTRTKLLTPHTMFCYNSNHNFKSIAKHTMIRNFNFSIFHYFPKALFLKNCKNYFTQQFPSLFAFQLPYTFLYYHTKIRLCTTFSKILHLKLVLINTSNLGFSQKKKKVFHFHGLQQKTPKGKGTTNFFKAQIHTIHPLSLR